MSTARPYYDLTVIGGGAGGLVVASGAAQLGAKVALVEKERALGGDCLHYGCVPTKALVHSARVLSLIQRAEEFGLSRPVTTKVIGAPALHPTDDQFAGAMAYMRRIIARVGGHDDPKRFEQMGITLYFGAGRFLDPHTLEVAGQMITSRRFVLATGSRPVALPIPGLAEAGYLTNITALQLTRRPASLIVLGGGPLGLEFAQVFQRLGVQVTVIEKMGQVLPKEDPEVAQVINAVLKREGMTVITSTDVQEVRKENGKKVVLAQRKDGPQQFTADEILLGVGRAPNVEGLNLEAAGVAYDRHGIQVDATLRTTARHIFACGDVAGPYQFTHMAEYQAGIVVANALFPFIPWPWRRKVDYRVVPWVTFTDPEVGRVGLTEQEAREQVGQIKIYRFPFKQVDRAIIEGEEEGLIKLVVDRGLRILGAHLIGPNAGDLLHEYVLAMKARLKITQLSQTIHVYPTLSQAVKKTADQYYREKLFSGWLPTLARLLIRLG